MTSEQDPTLPAAGCWGTHSRNKVASSYGGQRTGDARSVPPETKPPCASYTGAAEVLKKAYTLPSTAR